MSTPLPFPIAPLLAHLPPVWLQLGGPANETAVEVGPASQLANALVARFGMDRKHAQRAAHIAMKRGTTSAYQADRFATALGLHPSLIWPDWYQVTAA